MIGIIAAENKEMLAIKELMNDLKIENHHNLEFYVGKIKEKKCVLVECGIGKVNSARVTQVLIDFYEPSCVINVGSAGSTIPELNIEDIVIGKELIQYDFDVSCMGNYEKGEVCDVGKYFYSDSSLVDICKQTLDSMDNPNNNKVVFGRIGTADLFSANPEVSQKVHEEFGTICVEMEGAAIGQVCLLNEVPFLVIRGISDTPNGNNKIDFHTYLEHASKKAAQILYNIVDKIDLN